VHAITALVASALVTLLAGAAFAQTVVSVPGTSNPYLAGMPNGSTCCSGDSAPAQSPVQVTGVPIAPGTLLTFFATGSVSFDPTPPTLPPDGGFIFTTSSTNGISGATWPTNTLVGVFLDGNPPNTSAAPADLDFGPTGIGTAFATLSPALKQVFFIGDGRTGTGSGAAQTFFVPAGATRLFLGVSDGFGWFNNLGAFSVTVTPSGAGTSTAEIPVLAPPLLALLSLLLAFAGYRFTRRR
jgi:hypothetical protein